MISHYGDFSSLWTVLSSLYGTLLVVLMISFSLVEVLDNNVTILSLQGWYLLYLYVGSMAVIISIYVWVLINSCSSTPEPRVSSFEERRNPPTDPDIISFATSRFDSLKKVHISSNESSDCSLYLRFGAAAFGLGALVFNGLETALHSVMDGSCINEIMFVHPILHGLFTFLQMHFLFVNSQVVIKKFGHIARFGFMHLASTNLALWIRLIIWESGLEFVYYVYLTMADNLPRSDITYWPISQTHINEVVKLHNCLSANKLGQIWSSSVPFLYPFLAQFSIIAASATYIMGKKIGIDTNNKNIGLYQIQNKCDLKGNVSRHGSCNHSLCQGSEFDFNGSSKGLFLGLILIIVAVAVIIVFLVGKENDFCQQSLYTITSSTITAILLISFVLTIVGLFKIRRLFFKVKTSFDLDDTLSSVSLVGVQLYSVFGILVSIYSLCDNTLSTSSQLQHILLLSLSILQLAQSTTQSALIQEGLRRCAPTRTLLIIKPAKQILTFLLCTNISLWALDSFVTQNWISQEMQLRYMGVLAWGVISRITLPLIMLYRFHSAALLLEVIQTAYNKHQTIHVPTIA